MSMAGYTKLFNSILASTIWRAPDKTRIVWITMLAMADRDGVAEGSIPGIADMARVSVEDAKIAIAELESPDEHSRTTDFEGRRIEKVEGGWQILNHAKYREKMSADERREYFRRKQQEWRDRKKASNNVNDSERQSKDVKIVTHTEAEEDANTKEGEGHAPAVEDESVDVGRGPTEKQFIAECERHSIPAFYARDKWLAQDAKGWEKLPRWKSYVRRVSEWYVNDGRPNTPRINGSTQTPKKTGLENIRLLPPS